MVLSPYQLHSNHTRVQYVLYQGLGMKHHLSELTVHSHPLDLPASIASVPPYHAILPKAEEDPCQGHSRPLQILTGRLTKQLF